MSDELRDDIAAVIVAMGEADPVDVAQAVIDDLGLEVREDRLNGGYRVIGKWKES